MKRVTWEDAQRAIEEEEKRREEQRRAAWESKRAEALSLETLKEHDGKAAWDREHARCLCPRPACASHTRIPEHRSVRVNTKEGGWKCYRCQETGLLAEFWTYDDKPPEPLKSHKQRKRAAAIRAISAPPPPETEPREDAKRPAEEEQARNVAAFPGSPAAEYLAGRGIPPDVATAHGCGYAVWKEWDAEAAAAGRWVCTGEYARVTFPFRTRAGELCALQGRAIAECPGAPVKKSLGPIGEGVFNPAALSGSAPIITEAPIDALSLAACGYPAVALGGTAAPEWLPRALVAGTVYLATDADDAGDKAAVKLDAAIRLAFRCERLRPPDPWKDWNAALCGLGRDALAAWLAERIPPAVPPVTPTAQPASPPRLLCVHSRTLGETVRVVEAAARLPIPADGEPVTYTRAELELLDGQPADVLRTAHLLKRAFGGFYIGQAEDETPPPAATGTLF